MNLHDCDETGVQVVRLRFFGVEDLHWVSSSWDCEDWRFVEILRELHSVQCGRRYNQLHVCAFLYSLRQTKRNTQYLFFSPIQKSLNEEAVVHVAYLLKQTKEDVSVDRPLVSLIQHDDGVLAQFRVDQTLSQQHTVCHVLDHRLRAGAVLETDGVAHLQQNIIHISPLEMRPGE